MNSIGKGINGVGLMMKSPVGISPGHWAMGGKDRARDAKLSKAVNDFEALFVNNMLKTMRSTIQKSGLLGDGMGEDIYTSLFDWEISKEMAAGGGLGLGRMLLKEFNGREGAGEKRPLSGAGRR